MRQPTKWLESLKVGSKVVVVDGRSFSRSLRVAEVDRTTATQIVVGVRKYRRDSGRLVGDHYGGRLEEPTVELLKEMDEERRTNRANATIRELTEYHRWRVLELPELEKLAAFLAEIIPSKRAAPEEA